jgi:hypothetical protein
MVRATTAIRRLPTLAWQRNTSAASDPFEPFEPFHLTLHWRLP